jgi:hypothetical protein
MERWNEYYVVRPADVDKDFIWWGAERHMLPFTPKRSDIGRRLVLGTGGTLAVETVEAREAREWGPVDLPHGGDVAVLVSPWNWGGVKIGSIGLIGGYTDKAYSDGVSITFNFSAFLGQDYISPEHCSCSGGPGTIITPVNELTLVPGRIESVRVWMWADGCPRAANGYDYRRASRVWEWRPSNKVQA